MPKIRPKKAKEAKQGQIRIRPKKAAIRGWTGISEAGVAGCKDEISKTSNRLLGSLTNRYTMSKSSGKGGPPNMGFISGSSRGF